MCLSTIGCVHECQILTFFQSLFFLVVNARPSLTPGSVAPEMNRWVSVLTAVLFLHENTDHVTGIHKSNQLHERRGKVIMRTQWTLNKLLLQYHISTPITAIFRKKFLLFPEFICKFQCKWSHTAKLKILSFLMLRYILKSFPVFLPHWDQHWWMLLRNARSEHCIRKYLDLDFRLLFFFLKILKTGLDAYLCDLL